MSRFSAATSSVNSWRFLRQTVGCNYLIYIDVLQTSAFDLSNSFVDSNVIFANKLRLYR